MSRSICSLCAVAALALSLGVGCDDDPSEPALEVKTGKNSVELAVGERGGVLELESRARVTIPRDALDSETTLRMERGDLKELPARPDEYEVIGEPLVVTPHGLKLARSATVELAIDDDDSPEKDLRVLRLDNAKDRTWEEIDGVRLAKADDASRYAGDLETARDGEDTVTSQRRLEVQVDTFSIFLPVRFISIDRDCEGLAAGETCRSKAGQCDTKEVCDGQSSMCPTDEFATAGDACRQSAGTCDVAEVCDGESADCPEDGVRAADAVCRPARLACDVAEVCDGADTDCPADTGCGGSPAALSIMAGVFHTCAIDANGAVKCFGLNSRGQLGVGDTDDRGDMANEIGDALEAVNLGSGRTARSLATGSDYSCAILDDGSVKCWGRNDFGQLGIGDMDDRGDAPGEMGDNLPVVDLGSGRTAVAITANLDHACALLDDDSVKCWGYNGNGQLGLGDVDNRGDATGEMGDSLPAIDFGTGRTATVVTAGFQHTCALLDDASVKCWGRGEFGRLGSGAEDVLGDNPSEMGDNLPSIDLGSGRTATAVAAGASHGCAVLDDATVKCWGYNDLGQLGQGDTTTRGNAAGQMGDDLDPINLGSGQTPVAVRTGRNATCVMFEAGSVKCWGDNQWGNLGLGDLDARGDGPGEMGNNLPLLDFGSGRAAASLSTGSYHMCAQLDDGSVSCWGFGGYAQLGLGDLEWLGDEPNEMGDNLPAIDLGT